MPNHSIVFLVDVDETLMHTDRFRDDLARYLEREVSAACRDRYLDIESELFATLGYRDYLGALQRYRVEHPYDHRLNRISSFMLDYPVANLLYPDALDVLARFRTWGQPVIVTDGDIVFQPRKIERSGIADAVGQRALIYVHKEHELADIEHLYPADHYVLVDDKLHILLAFKNVRGKRVTTVRPQQGSFAHNSEWLKRYPRADLTIDRISNLLDYELPMLPQARIASA